MFTSSVGPCGLPREQPHGPAQWCDETHNSLLKSCMATFQPLGTLGSCLDFRKFPKLAAPRGAALHVMYCTCVNMCNGWLFVPVHVCVPAPPGVFLPVHVCPGSPRCLFTGTCLVFSPS